MNEQPCEQYIEWMSLAQDGMLNSTQTRLLHVHLAGCPSCQALWESMTWVSQALHAVPMAAPPAGFVSRFEARLAYRQEQRRQMAVWVMLGVGVVALLALALPSIIGTLRLTGFLILPDEVWAYIYGLGQWIAIVLDKLGDTAWVLLRYAAARPTVWTCVASAAVAGAIAIAWTWLVWGRLPTQRARE